MMRVGAERRIQGMQLESDTCRARLSALQEECRKMEEMVANMLQYKAKVDQLKQESASMKTSYETNLQKYCSHISTLERDNMVLRNQVKKMESQIHGKGDERDKSKLLLERLKMVEAENSSLVLENEQQRQQYEKCLDEIANQVVQALLAQKMLREECFKLQTRVHDLELQNKHLNLMFQQRMRMATDSVNHLCPATTSASNGMTLSGGEMTLDFMATTGSLHSMCSEIMGDDSPGKPQLSSPPPWLRDKLPPDPSNDVTSSSSPDSITSSNQSRSTPVDTLEQAAVQTKIETEFPATNASPKMKHVSVSSKRRSRSLERGSSGPFGWMKRMGKAGTRSRRGSETQEKNYDPPPNLKQSSSADALTHYGVKNKKGSSLLSQSMDTSAWRDSLTPERLNAKDAKLLLRTTSADIDSEKSSGICDINHQSFEAFNKSFEKLLAKNSIVDEAEKKTTKPSSEKKTATGVKSATTTKDEKNPNLENKKSEKKQFSPSKDPAKSQHPKSNLKYQASPALRNPFAEPVKSPTKSPSPLPGQYYYYDYSDEDSDSRPVSRDFSTASTMSLNEILDSSQEAEVALDDDFFSDWSSVCISPQKRIDRLTGQTISNNAMVSLGREASTSTSSSSSSSKLSSSSPDSSRNQRIDAAINAPNTKPGMSQGGAKGGKPEPIYDEPYIPEHEAASETISSPVVSKTVSQKAVTRSLTDPSMNTTREVKADIHTENFQRSFQPSPSLSPNPSQISQDLGYVSKGSYSQSSPSPSPSISHRGTPPWLHSTKDPHSFSRNELLSLVINREAISASPRSIPNGSSPSDTLKLVRPGQLILAPQDKNLNFQGFSSASSEDRSPIKMFESKQSVNMESSVIEVKKDGTLKSVSDGAGAVTSGDNTSLPSPRTLQSPSKIPPPVARKPMRAVKPEARMQPKDEKKKSKDDSKTFPGPGHTNMTVGFVLQDPHNLMPTSSKTDALMENLVSNVIKNVKNQVSKHHPEFGSPLQTKICPSSDSSFENLRVERSGSKDDGYSTMSSDIHPEMMEKFCDTLTLKRSETEAVYIGNKSASLRIDTSQRCCLERRNSDSVLQNRDHSFDLISDQDSAMETSVHSTTEMITSSSSQVSTSSTDLASPTSTTVSRIARLFETPSGKAQPINSTDQSPKMTPTKSPSSPKSFFPSPSYQQPESPRRLANEFQKNSCNNNPSTVVKKKSSPVSQKNTKGTKAVSTTSDKNDKRKPQASQQVKISDSSKPTQMDDVKKTGLQNAKVSSAKGVNSEAKKQPTTKPQSPDAVTGQGTNKTSSKNDKQLPRGFYKQSSLGKIFNRKSNQASNEKGINKSSNGGENHAKSKIKYNASNTSDVSAEFTLVLAPDSNASKQGGVVLELVKDGVNKNQQSSGENKTADVEFSVILESSETKIYEKDTPSTMVLNNKSINCTVNSTMYKCDSCSSNNGSVSTCQCANSSTCSQAIIHPTSCEVSPTHVTSTDLVTPNDQLVANDTLARKSLIVLTNDAFQQVSSDSDDETGAMKTIQPRYQPIPPLTATTCLNDFTNKKDVSDFQISSSHADDYQHRNQLSSLPSSSSSLSSLSSSYLCNSTTANHQAISSSSLSASAITPSNNDQSHYYYTNIDKSSASVEGHPSLSSSNTLQQNSKECQQQQPQQHHHHQLPVNADHQNNDNNYIPFLRRSHSEHNIRGSRPKSTSNEEELYSNGSSWASGMPLQRSVSASQLDQMWKQHWGNQQHYFQGNHTSSTNSSASSSNPQLANQNSFPSMHRTSHHFQRFHGYHNVYGQHRQQQHFRLENYPLLTRSLRLDLSDVTELDEDGSEAASMRDSLDNSTGHVTSDESPRLSTDDQKQFNSQFYSLCQLGSNKSLLSSSYDSKEKLSPTGFGENVSVSNRSSSGRDEEDEIALLEFDKISRQIANLSKTVDELNHSLSSLNSGEFEPSHQQARSPSWDSHSTKTDVIDGYHWADDEFYLTSCNGKVIISSSGNNETKDRNHAHDENSNAKDNSDVCASEDASDEFYVQRARKNSESEVQGHTADRSRSSRSVSPSNFETVIRRQKPTHLAEKKLVRWTSEGNVNQSSQGDKRLSMPLCTYDLEKAFEDWDEEVKLLDLFASSSNSTYDNDDSDEDDDDSLASDIGLDHMMCQRLIGPNTIGQVKDSSSQSGQSISLSQIVCQLSKENQKEVDRQVLNLLGQKGGLSESSKKLLDMAIVSRFNRLKNGGDRDTTENEKKRIIIDGEIIVKNQNENKDEAKCNEEKSKLAVNFDEDRLKVPETRDIGIDAMSGSQNSLSNSLEIISHLSSHSLSLSSSSSSLSLSMSSHNNKAKIDHVQNNSQPKSSTPEPLGKGDGELSDTFSMDYVNVVNNKYNKNDVFTHEDCVEGATRSSTCVEIQQSSNYVNMTMDKITTYSDFVADLEMNAIGECHSPSHLKNPKRTITNGSLTSSSSSLERRSKSCLHMTNSKPVSPFMSNQQSLTPPPRSSSSQSQHRDSHHRHTFQFPNQQRLQTTLPPFHHPLAYHHQYYHPQPACHPHAPYVNQTIPCLPPSRPPPHYTSSPRPQSYPSAVFNPSYTPSSPPPPAPHSNTNTLQDSSPPPLPPRNPKVSRTQDGRPQVMIRPHRIQKDITDRPHSFNHYLINQSKSSFEMETTNQRIRSKSVTSGSGAVKQMDKGKTKPNDNSASKIPRRKLKTRRELSKRKKGSGTGDGGAGSRVLDGASRSWRDIDVDKGTPLSDSSGGDSSSS